MPARPAYPWETPPTGDLARLADSLQDTVPRLVTARLALRAPRIDDFGAYGEIMMSERARYMDGPFGREAAWLEFTSACAGWLLRGHGLWTVTAKTGGQVLGFVPVHQEFADHEPELGFFFRASAEGRGLAYEAAVAARDHAVGELKLDALVSYMAPGNIRSIALAERLGAWRDDAAARAFPDHATDPILVYRHWPPADDDGGMEAYE